MKKKEKVILICQQCGKKFKTHCCYRNSRKFCSLECCGKWKSQNIKGKNHPGYTGETLILCKQCGEEFKVRISSKDRKFCSYKCYWNSMNKKKIKLICKQCNNIFYSLREDAKFCSKDCCSKNGIQNHKLDCQCIACKAKRGETKGHFVSKETINKIILANTGRVLSKESREKIGFAFRGKNISEEHKLKIKNHHEKYLKNKTYEEIHGEEKAAKIRSKQSLAQGGNGVSGDTTEYGSEFDNILREQIRFRSNYKCQECGCSQLENGKQL